MKKNIVKGNSYKNFIEVNNRSDILKYRLESWIIQNMTFNHRDSNGWSYI